MLDLDTDIARNLIVRTVEFYLQSCFLVVWRIFCDDWSGHKAGLSSEEIQPSLCSLNPERLVVLSALEEKIERKNKLEENIFTENYSQHLQSEDVFLVCPVEQEVGEDDAV